MPRSANFLARYETRERTMQSATRKDRLGCRRADIWPGGRFKPVSPQFFLAPHFLVTSKTGTVRQVEARVNPTPILCRSPHSRIWGTERTADGAVVVSLKSRRLSRKEPPQTGWGYSYSFL
jgi:hypothetical protein